MAVFSSREEKTPDTFPIYYGPGEGVITATALMPPKGDAQDAKAPVPQTPAKPPPASKQSETPNKLVF